MITKQNNRKNAYQRCRSIAIGAAVAMPLCVATTGTVTVATMSLSASSAHAFGLSDITGAAKKVGKKVKKAAKTAGSGFKGLAKGAAKGAGKVAKEAGALGYGAAKGVVTTTRDAAIAASTDAFFAAAKPAVRELEKRKGNYDNQRFEELYAKAKRIAQSAGRDYIDKPLGKLKDKIKNNTGRGTLTSRNGPRSSNRQQRRRAHGQIVASGKRSPVQGRKQYTPGQWGGNQQTSAKLPPARRPARKLPPPRNQRPRPITENDVKPPFCNSKFENCSKPKPSRPFCNSKFENCSGKHKRKGKKYNGRDRSVWGRPVGNPRKRSKNTIARDKSVWGRPLKLEKSFARKRAVSRRNLRKNVRANKMIVRGYFKRKITRPASISVKPRSVRRNAKRVQFKKSQRRIDRGFKAKRFERKDRRNSSRRSSKRRG